MFIVYANWYVTKSSNLRIFLTEISLTLSLITLYIFGCSLRRCSFQGYYLPRLSDPFRQLSLKHFVSKVIPNSCGHVVMDFESKTITRCNFQFQKARRHWFYKIFKNDNVQGLTSHSAYVATETELYGAKLDGLLPPNFL